MLGMKRWLFLLAICGLYAAFSAAAEGVHVSSDTARPNLLREISREIDSDASPETRFEARRQARLAAQKAEAYLNAQGYFAPDIAFAVDAGPPLRGRVNVEPGSRFSVSYVEVDTGETVLPLAASQAPLTTLLIAR